jgi:hypothetical protein
MPDGWLAGTPLTGWVLPGVALLIGVAVPQLAAAVLDSGRGAAPGWPPASGRVAPGRVDRGGAADPAAVIFPWPVIAGIGAAEILLARRWQRSGKIVTGSRDQRP